MKRIALVDPGFKDGKEPYLAKLAALPYELSLLVNGDRRVPEAPWWLPFLPAERVHVVSFLDAAKAIRALDAVPRFDGFYTYFEEAVPLTQALAAYFGTPTITTKDVAPLRHKGKMRAALTAAGVAQPRARVCTTEAECRAAVAELGVPCVVKPAEMMASLGVRKVSTVEDVAVAFREASEANFVEEDTRHCYGLGQDVVVESYLAADFEMSCEVVVERGTVLAWYPTGKRLGPEPHFREIGHVHPQPLGAALERAIGEVLPRIVAALGIDSAVCHAEFRVKGEEPTLVEIGARVAGGLIALVVERSRGVDLLRVGMELAAGETPELREHAPRTVTIRFREKDGHRVGHEITVDSDPESDR